MYKTKPCGSCVMPAPAPCNTLYYAQLLKEKPLVPEALPAHA